MLLFALVILFVLGFLVPGLLLSSLEGEMSANFFLMFLIVIWCAVRLVYTGLKGKRRLTLMLFYVFIYVFMGVQPLLSVWSNIFPHSELEFTSSMVSFCIVILLLGIVGFEIGYYQFGSKKAICGSENIGNGMKETARSMSINLLWFLSFSVTLLFIFCIVNYGPDVFLGLRGGGFTISESQRPDVSSTENQLVVFGLRGLASTLLFIAIYMWKTRKFVSPSYKTVRLRIVIGYLIFINLLISNPLNAPRLWSGAVLLTSLFIYLDWKGPKSFLIWSSAGCLGMLLLFSGLDPRLIFSKQLIFNDEITLSNTLKEVGTSIENLPGDYNFDAFQMMFYTTVYTDKMGYSFGNQLLLPAFFWVPRSIWPSKPIGSPDIVAAHAGFESLNVSSPLWTEGYINFSVPGVFLFLFIFGWCARLGDDSLSNLQLRSAFVTILSSFFASNTLILLRGDLTVGTMYVQMIILFTILLLIFLKISAKTRLQINSTETN
jgi:hypothetical protein